MRFGVAKGHVTIHVVNIGEDAEVGSRHISLCRTVVRLIDAPETRRTDLPECQRCRTLYDSLRRGFPPAADNT